VSLDPNRPIVPQPYSPVAPEPMTASSVPTSPVAPAPVTGAPAPVNPARNKSSGGGRWLNVVLGVAFAVAIAGVAFAVGRTTAPASAATGGRGGFGGQFPGGSFAPRASGEPGFGGGRGGFGGAFGAGLTISGTVVSVNGDTLTLKTASGQTIEVTTGASTTYNTQTTASASDVAAGKTVQVQLDVTGGGGGLGRPNASGAPAGPTGTASSVTVVP
jgi:hypothetical protein